MVETGMQPNGVCGELSLSVDDFFSGVRERAMSRLYTAVMNGFQD